MSCNKIYYCGKKLILLVSFLNIYIYLKQEKLYTIPIYTGEVPAPWYNYEESHLEQLKILNNCSFSLLNL